jgi:histidinol-phosphate aminotransferase
MNNVPAARADILALKSYKAGDQVPDTIRLNANEAPVSDDLPALNRYPEVHPRRLSERLSELFGIPPENLLVTRGSSEAIDVLTRAWCGAYEHSIATTPPTFDMYRVYADIQGVRVTGAPLNQDRDFALDVEALLDVCDATTRIVFLCSPNNPTGTVIPRKDILAITQALAGQSLVVVDEAYIEFSTQDSLADLVNAHNNLVVLRTLSKAHALAGARCGVAIACEPVIDVMCRVLPPYSFATPVIESVLAALSPARIARSRETVDTLISERERLDTALRNQSCIDRTWPSQANFLLARFHDLASVREYLFGKRILIRNFSDGIGLDNCARITVGTETENDALIDALQTFPGGK